MDQKIGFGIIGFGIFGKKRLIPGFSGSKLGKIVAITKTNKEEAENEAKSYGISNAYAYSEKSTMLKNPDIEAVYVAGPNHLHMQDAIDSLRAGKHVIMEKPMALNSDECKKIIEVAKETGKKLMIAQCLRFNDTVNFFKEYRESGKLGKLIHGTADYCFNASFSSRSWLLSKKISGGGPSFDLGAHTIDTLRYITGLEVEDSKCISYPERRDDDQVEKTAHYTMKFEKEFIGRSIVSFIPEYTTFLELVGTEGTIRATKWTLIESIVDVTYTQLNEVNTVQVHNRNQYSLQIDEFCKSIINETEVPVSGEEGLKNQLVFEKI